MYKRQLIQGSRDALKARQEHQRLDAGAPQDRHDHREKAVDGAGHLGAQIRDHLRRDPRALDRQKLVDRAHVDQLLHHHAGAQQKRQDVYKRQGEHLFLPELARRGGDLLDRPVLPVLAAKAIEPLSLIHI